MTITIEQLQKQLDVLTDSNKMLLKVIAEKNEQISIYEFMLRAEEEDVFTFTPEKKTN
jgi:predicted transcriptional regulator